MAATAEQKLRELSAIIRKTARELAPLQEQGGIEETLKWGQQSFLPKRRGIGTTIRIDQANDQEVALYVHCQTTLVDTYRSLFSELKFEGNRVVLFPIDKPLPKETIRVCVTEALLYHHNKKLRAS